MSETHDERCCMNGPFREAHTDCPGVEALYDSPQTVTYNEALLEGFDPYEDAYDERGEL